MRLITYEHHPPESRREQTVFLIGPTARDGFRTPWRAEAVKLLSELSPDCAIVIPEFALQPVTHEQFAAMWDDGEPSSIPNLRRSTQRVLDWETAWIDMCSAVIAWMPLSDDMPGKTTRGEVGRASALAPGRPEQFLVYGCPEGSDTMGHVKYHAWLSRVPVVKTLRECCEMAAHAMRRERE